MLRELATDVWEATSDFRVLPGAHLPAHMAIVRRDDGSLLLHSPIAISDALAEELKKLGPVRTIVAPNAFHHLHVRAAKERFPGARCLVARGVERKQPGLEVAGTLEDCADELASDFDVTQLQGAPKLNEWVFLHRASGALITTDLLFNVTTPRGWLTPLVLTLAGTSRGLAISRITKSLVKDADAFTRSVEESVRAGVRHLVMCHGEAVSQDADGILRRALIQRFG